MPIDSHLSYFEKHAAAPPQIDAPPHADLGMAVVIPCFNEPGLIGSLEALASCEPPGCAVEVITVINSGVHHPVEVREQNLRTLDAARAWAGRHATDDFRFHFLHFPGIRKKHAGVGMARKLGMDEAVYRLEQAGRPDAPIVCFDADAGCDRNYLAAIDRYFRERGKVRACSIYFEHPLEGQLAPEVYAGIARYELFLRYYVQALRYAGHPHAFHTIGSSMAVRSSEYQRQGGMNRRKAGEDFHFLQKIIPHGRFGALNATRVIPSPRPSDRVPFGTGRAIGAYLAEPAEDYPVYAPVIFEELRTALAGVRDWYGIDERAVASAVADMPPAPGAWFSGPFPLTEHLAGVAANTTSPDAFVKRFFFAFNGLKALQYVHFAREHFYPNVPVNEAAGDLLEKMGMKANGNDVRSLLAQYRALDRGWSA